MLCFTRSFSPLLWCASHMGIFCPLFPRYFLKKSALLTMQQCRFLYNNILYLLFKLAPVSHILNGFAYGI